ncbi:MAG: hypothetical protein ACP5K9_01785 [Candidatus Micrarchaeia archaeon]
MGNERVEKGISAPAAKRLRARLIIERKDGGALSALLEKEFLGTLKVLGEEGATDRDKRAFIIESLSSFAESHQSTREAEVAEKTVKTLEVIDMLDLLKGG